MSEQFKIRWGDLGPPAWPCEMDYFGKRIIVTARDIEAAKGNPDTVFTARRALILPERYFLGSVEVFSSTASPGSED